MTGEQLNKLRGIACAIEYREREFARLAHSYRVPTARPGKAGEALIKAQAYGWCAEALSDFIDQLGEGEK